MQRLETSMGQDLLATHINSMPQRVTLMSACTGSGSFELAARAAVNALADLSGREKLMKLARIQ